MQSEQTLGFVFTGLFTVVVAGIILLLAHHAHKGPGKKEIFLNKTRQRLKLKEKIQVSPDTVLLRLALPAAEMILGLPIGKHFKIYSPNPAGKVKGEWNGKADPEAELQEIERKYTPVTGDEVSGHVDLVVKVYKGGVKPQFVDGGKMSQYLDSLKIGDKVELQGPLGLIEYKGKGAFTFGKREFKKKRVAMIAGGTGVTPMLQIIKAVLRDATDRTEVSLLFANQTEDDILCRQELEALQKANPDRFKLSYTLDRPPANWTHSTGFITKEMIQQRLPAAGEDTIVLLCGPPPMLKFACHPNLDALGYSKEDRLEF